MTFQDFTGGGIIAGQFLRSLGNIPLMKSSTIPHNTAPFAKRLPVGGIYKMKIRFFFVCPNPCPYWPASESGKNVAVSWARWSSVYSSSQSPSWMSIWHNSRPRITNLPCIVESQDRSGRTGLHKNLLGRLNGYSRGHGQGWG